MSAQTPLARLRRFEFRSALAAMDPRWPWRAVASHQITSERLLSGLGLGFGLFVLLLWAASTRAPEVRWTGLEVVGRLILRAPLGGYWMKLFGLVLSWLVWGLGGLIILAATFFAGWGWRERPLLRSAGEQGRPLLELLPLSEGQVAQAKLQGRLAAWLISAAVSVLVSFLATRLMIAFRVVNSTPSLVDPWLIAGFFSFFSFMTLARECTGTLRRRDQNAATWRLVVLLIGGGLVTALGNSLGLLHFGVWNAAAVAGLMWLGIALATRVPYPPAQAGLTTGRSWLWSPMFPWMEALFHEGRRAMLPTWPPRPGSLRLRRLMPSALLLTGLVATCGVLLQGLVLAGTWLWAVWQHVPLALARGVAGGAAFALPVVVVLVVFANVTILAAWWPEFPPPPHARRRRNPWARLEMRHLGFLLPVAARQRWLQGLGAYLLAVAILLPLGAASYLIVWWTGQRLAGSPLQGVGPRVLLALPLSVLIGLMFHAVAPLLRHASRVFALTGCLLSLPLYSGLMVVEIASVRLLETHAAATHVALAMAVWAALMLAISYWWTEPRTWRRRPDGTPAAPARLRAVLVLTSLFPSFGFVLAAIFAVMAFSAFGGR